VDLLDRFKGIQVEKEFSANDVIFYEGDAADAMYIILEGEVDVQAHNESVFKAGKGEILGEMALIDSGPRSACAIAVTDCKLGKVDKERFLDVVKRDPGISLQVMETLVRRLRSMDARAGGR
jgi:CRP-like cAMP-binding protein